MMTSLISFDLTRTPPILHHCPLNLANYVRSVLLAEPAKKLWFYGFSEGQIATKSLQFTLRQPTEQRVMDFGRYYALSLTAKAELSFIR